MNRKIIVISLFGVLFLFTSESNFVWAEKFEVIIPSNAANPQNLLHFIPSDLNIVALDTVTWKNNDAVIHTVTSGTFSSGPDGTFNSGPLEPGDSFSYQFLWEDSGIVTYFCTIHPWINGFVKVVDPQGVPVGRITESGSVEFAQENISKGYDLTKLAQKFVKYDDIINSHRQAARHYDNAAAEYVLLEQHQNAAQYYQESAMQYYLAAIQLENSGKLDESIKHHYLAGTQYHNAALQFSALGDYTNYGKQFGESLKHKRMAKYGSDYVMPPKQQMKWLAVPQDVECNPGLGLIFKSSNGEPVCFTPESASKLVQRGWARR